MGVVALTALLFVALLIGSPSACAEQAQNSTKPLPCNACCGVNEWPMDHGMMGHGMMEACLATTKQ